MIQIPLALAIIVVIAIHTIATHLFNWGIREADNEGDINAIALCIFFSFLEIVLTIALLCNMKPV